MGRKNGQKMKKHKCVYKAGSNMDIGNSENIGNSYRIVEREKQQSYKEYEMMRTEILQYLEEYQSVRNMMYLATATILGVNSIMFQNYYLFLLPLMVILPSYIIFYNYWRSVTCASTYIQVFLDDEAVQTTYHWEIRHRYFGYIDNDEKRQIGDRLRGLDVRSHRIPYLISGGLCLVLYCVNMFWHYITPYIRLTIGATIKACTDAFRYHFLTAEGIGLVTTWRVIADVLLGIVFLVLLIYIFKVYWNVDRAEMTRAWEYLKNIDMQHEDELRKKLGLRQRYSDR